MGFSTNRIIDSSTNFTILAFLTLLFTSCSSPSYQALSLPNERLSTATEMATFDVTQQPVAFGDSYGVTITVTSLCSDGVTTTLYLRTDINLDFWQLNEDDFYPDGKTYFETGVLFLEDGKLFSMYSSGKREDPFFDSPKHIESVTQIFIFPKALSRNSEFVVKAKVSLHDLDLTYVPPVAMSFLEAGIIEIPMEYVVPASTSDDCP